MGQTWMAEPDANRIAFGPRAGHKVLTLHCVMPQRPAQPEEANEAAAIAECEAEPAQGRPGRIRAARLLQRVLDIDLQQCPSVPPCP